MVGAVYEFRAARAKEKEEYSVLAACKTLASRQKAGACAPELGAPLACFLIVGVKPFIGTGLRNWAKLLRA